MSNNRIIVALCYFSIFFAGIILPLIVWLVVQEDPVKKHARAAFFSHILMYFPILIGFIVFFVTTYSATEMTIETYSAITISIFIIAALLTLAIVIWNVYRGIKVLANKEDFL